ncbi:MAG: 8-oxo-dGTP diphosphatase [Elusimicrobiales bacterium]|nr:8-oxo-dGTP diphosphatase [Elusimicrobiales bacterium]
MKLATLCYVRKNGRTLMLHRVKKADDVHEGKWNGLGGKFEPGESPEDCVIREIREEAGLKLKAPVLKGVLTFPDFAKGDDWYVFVFTASRFTGRLIESPEGDLKWIPDRELLKLNLWEGDKVFLPLLRRRGCFSGKFVYRNGRLAKYSLEKYS